LRFIVIFDYEKDISSFYSSLVLRAAFALHCAVKNGVSMGEQFLLLGRPHQYFVFILGRPLFAVCMCVNSSSFRAAHSSILS